MSDVSAEPTLDGSGNNNGNDPPNGKSVTSQESSVLDPLAKVKPSDALLDIYQQQANTVFGSYARTHGMTLKEYYRALDERARDLLENARLWMRVDNPDDLEAILRDGEFRSGFETGSLTGIKADFRTATESGLFGYSTDMDPADRPLYGYPTADSNGEGYAAVKRYGPIAIRFNDDVGSRTTVTFGDTLTASNGRDELTMVATPFKNPSGRSFQTFVPGEPVPDPLNTSDADLMKYAELQYHGGLSVSDVAEVVFHHKPPPSVRHVGKSRYFI